MNCVVGIDIGGTNIRIGTVWEDGRLEHFIKKSSAYLNTPDASNQLVQEIKNYVATHQLDGKVQAVTIGVPSSVSKDKSKIYSTPNLDGLENIDLGKVLKESLGLQVIIDRDVNFLLINDISAHNLDPEGNKTILGMYLGTGFGNAVYINGDIFTGKNGVAGELGHIPMYGNTDRCTCGNIGCTETRVSGRYLKSLQEHNYPETDIGDMFIKHGQDKILQQFIDDAGLIIATEINILDPDYVILAGGVMNMAGFPLEQLKERISEKLRRPYPYENIEFISAKHTQESGVLGGAIYARTHWL